MPRPSISDAAMSGAERQARYRAARGRCAGGSLPSSGAPPQPEPTLDDAVASLTALVAEYTAWLDALPDNQQDSATAEALRAIAELDLSELHAIQPPRGFGRD